MGHLLGKRITHRFSQRLKLGASVREHAVNRKQGSVGKGCLAIPQAMGGLPEMVMTERHRRADPQPMPANPMNRGASDVPFVPLL